MLGYYKSCLGLEISQDSRDLLLKTNLVCHCHSSVHVISYTCASPTMTCKNVCFENGPILL